jgi:chromosome segregation ATPase
MVNNLKSEPIRQYENAYETIDKLRTEITEAENRESNHRKTIQGQIQELKRLEKRLQVADQRTWRAEKDSIGMKRENKRLNEALQSVATTLRGVLEQFV